MRYRFLLDTDILSGMARNPAGPVRQRIAAVGAEVVCTSVVVSCEIEYGVAKRGSLRLKRQMSELLGALEVLRTFPHDIGRHYAFIRCDLEARGVPIGPNDLLIAAHARAEALTLVTGNTREFARVPGLAVENWLEPRDGLCHTTA